MGAEGRKDTRTRARTRVGALQALEKPFRGPGEKAFQQQVLDYARLMGWKAYHPWISVRSEPGFPDVVAVRAGRLVVAELKSMTGKLTPAQEEWLGALGGVPCCEVFIWYPTEDYWQEIERVFR